MSPMKRHTSVAAAWLAVAVLGCATAPPPRRAQARARSRSWSSWSWTRCGPSTWKRCGPQFTGGFRRLAGRGRLVPERRVSIPEYRSRAPATPRSAPAPCPTATAWCSTPGGTVRRRGRPPAPAIPRSASIGYMGKPTGRRQRRLAAGADARRTAARRHGRTFGGDLAEAALRDHPGRAQSRTPSCGSTSAPAGRHPSAFTDAPIPWLQDFIDAEPGRAPTRARPGSGCCRSRPTRARTMWRRTHAVRLDAGLPPPPRRTRGAVPAPVAAQPVRR